MSLITVWPLPACTPPTPTHPLDCPSQLTQAVLPFGTLKPHASDCQRATTRMVAVVEVSDWTHAATPPRQLRTFPPHASAMSVPQFR